MPSYDDLVRRAHEDLRFAELVRTDPVAALAGHRLTHEQLRALDRLVRGFGVDGQPGAEPPGTCDPIESARP